MNLGTKISQHPPVTFLYYCLLFQGSDVDDEDIDELLRDTRLLKKLKKGKISEEDFDKQLSAEGSSKLKKAGPAQEDGAEGGSG